MFLYKLDLENYLIKYKARLCTRRDLEPLNLYEEITIIIFIARVFRIIITITAYFNYNIY